MSYSISKKYLFYLIYLFFIFFPFLSIFRFPTDSQPNGLFFSLIILLTTKKILKFNYLYLNIFFTFIISFFIFLISSYNIANLLNFSIYISILIIPYTVFFTLKKINGLPYNFFKLVVYIWGIVGLIQNYVYKNFLTFLIMRSSGTSIYGRGVGSFAPEPTYYGTVCLFFLIIYLLNFKFKKNYFLLFFIIFQIFILSKSSTVIFILFLSSLLYILFLFFKFKILNSFALLALFTFFMLQFKLFDFFWENTRFYKILNVLIENPEIILKDESISERINHAYFPILSVIENNGIPHLFGTFNNYINLKISSGNHSILLHKEINTDHYKKIMNAYGSIIFDLGIFSTFLFYTIFKLFKSILFTNLIIFIFLLFNFSLFTAISFNNSLILFIIGNLFYLNHNNHVKE